VTTYLKLYPVGLEVKEDKTKHLDLYIDIAKEKHLNPEIYSKSPISISGL